MSDRHMHITSHLGGQNPARIQEFIGALRAVDNGFFDLVQPVVSPMGSVIAVAMYSRDLDGISDELAMPRVVEHLAGILERDIWIVSAWEGIDEEYQRRREHLWRVPGRGWMNTIDGETVHARPGIDATDG